MIEPEPNLEKYCDIHYVKFITDYARENPATAAHARKMYLEKCLDQAELLKDTGVLFYFF